MADDEQEKTTGPASADLAPGTTLSNTYEIVEHLALGGMAEVYRARNIHTDEPVAIKVVLPEYARDETRLALFRKEATTLSRLHHEAIVHYHLFTVEKETNRPYLVMEFVEGTPLSDRMKSGPLDAQSVKTLIQRVATGLSAAHEAGVVHRDLSPDNVVLLGDNVAKAKIIDFGIAKDTGGGGGTLLGGKFAGKYNFVSPEQLGLYGGDITGQSDIYSLGLIALAALRGEALDMSGTHAEVIDKRRTVPDLADVDDSIRPAISAMLTPDPAARPKTMQDVVALLTAAPTAKPMPGGADDPWGDPAPAAKPGTAPTPWDQPADGRTVIAPRPLVRPPPPGSASRAPVRGGGATVVTSAPSGGPAGAQSESPFGAYTPPPGAASPLQTPPPRPQAPGTLNIASKQPQKRGAGGLIALVVVLILVAGGGGFAFTQNWFGLLGPAPVPKTPEEDIQVAEPDVPEPEPNVTEPSGNGSSLVPEDVADQDPAGPEPTTTDTAETAEPEPGVVEPDVVEPDVTEPDIQVADVEGPQIEIPPLEGVPAMLAWVDSYPLTTCQFAQALAADERSMTIEAFGTEVPPFEDLMNSFQAEHGIEPDIFMRVASADQCPAVDFLRSVKPLAEAGPRLNVENTQVARGQRLAGNLQAISGWKSDVLLVDDAGIVHTVALSPSSSGAAATFSAPLTTTASGDVPMIVISISSRDGLITPASVEGVPASTAFPAILREVQQKGSDVAVGVKYVKLE